MIGNEKAPAENCGRSRITLWGNKKTPGSAGFSVTAQFSVFLELSQAPGLKMLHWEVSRPNPRSAVSSRHDSSSPASYARPLGRKLKLDLEVRGGACNQRNNFSASKVHFYTHLGANVLKRPNCPRPSPPTMPGKEATNDLDFALISDH